MTGQEREIVPGREGQVVHVRTGADRILDDARDVIAGKTIGILTNHTGRLSDSRHLIDAVVESGIARVAALFGPEHGITGDTPDGQVVGHSTHPHHSIPVYSLYGKTHKPTKEMLRGLDVLVCDIQDVGARFYTFISTVALAMEAAAEEKIRFVILDRPNPIRGLQWDGPVREKELKSFVSWMPIPVTHGMTLGELTRMWNGERWSAGGVQADLQVVPMDGWTRDLWFDETGLPWVQPSPNMQSLDTAVVYPGLCFIEGTSLAEGRGTPAPFGLLGAPWADTDRVVRELAALRLSGVRIEPATFIPHAIPGVASNPKYEDVECRGIRVTVARRDEIQPVRLGLAVLAAFKRSHPRDMVLEHRRFDILTGNRSVRKMLEAGNDPAAIASGWEEELAAFGAIRSNYLLYS